MGRLLLKFSEIYPEHEMHMRHGEEMFNYFK